VARGYSAMGPIVSFFKKNRVLERESVKRPPSPIFRIILKSLHILEWKWIATWKHQADVFKFFLCFVEKSPGTDYGLIFLWDNHLISFSWSPRSILCTRKGIEFKFQHIFAPQNLNSPWQCPFKWVLHNFRVSFSIQNYSKLFQKVWLQSGKKSKGT